MFRIPWFCVFSGVLPWPAPCPWNFHWEREFPAVPWKNSAVLFSALRQVRNLEAAMHIDTDGKPPDVLCHKAASETRGGEHHDQGAFRYAAYLARVKSLVSMKAAGAARYLAFTSDVGEAARPLVPPAVVHASYGIAGAYMIGDVAYHGYRWGFQLPVPIITNAVPRHLKPATQSVHALPFSLSQGSCI